MNESEMKRSTASITGDRKLLLEKKALEIGVKVGKVVKWTDILNYMIDHYTQDAAEDMKSSLKE